MNAVLTVFSLLIVAFIVLAVPTIVAPHSAEYEMVYTSFDGAQAVLLFSALASLGGWFFYRQKNGSFLLRIFVAAVLIRVLLGTIIFMFNGREFFGGDAIHYDY